jgi:hypothetical protein
MGRNFRMPEKGIPSEKCTKNDALLPKTFPKPERRREYRHGSCAFALFGASRLGFHEFLRTLLKNQQQCLE